ncbi:hypothetical protein [Erythrobacter sp. R86502]|uniref:hypothetical protein n=1 Tax=Erythrobacter sp. R86502 TaxID=3093846 RepID=UPI0036D3C056
MIACLMLLSPFPAIAADDPPLTLTSFGAVGDDRVDDTQTLQIAFRQAAGRCLDGEGRTYRVRGSLRVAADFCLANARFRQDVAPFDTRPWIQGDCPVEKDAEALADCGDPAMPDPLPAGLEAYLYTRTLLIRPERGEPPIKVSLRNVTVDRGSSPESGARSDAAGIWIGNARGLVIEDVEVTGAGKGYGVMIVDSADITIRRLRLRNLVWSPYAGDATLSLDRARHDGWNSVPIREFRRAGDRGARDSGFHGTRSQEQLTCLAIERSINMQIDDLRIDGCRARFAEGDIPWQTDGLAIGRSSSDIHIEGARIANTWEAIDIVGGGSGVERVSIRRAEISDSFNYGMKVGYDTRDVSIVDSLISRAGLAGVLFYGPVSQALIRQVRITDPGNVFFAGALQQPWMQERAGVVVDMGSSAATVKAYPRRVTLDSVKVEGNGACRFGLLNFTPERLAQEGLQERGCESPGKHSPR